MKTATITFPDDYPDATVEVVVSPVPVAAYWDIVARLNEFRPSRDAFEGLATDFAPFLSAWSFDAPADVTGLMATDYNLILGIVQAWAVEVRDAPLPLSVRSSGIAKSKASRRRPLPEPSS